MTAGPTARVQIYSTMWKMAGWCPTSRTSTQEQRRAAARRARAKRRRLRQLALIGTACGILVVSGVITALLPAKGADAPLTSDAPANTRLVAPVPYAGSNGSTGTAQALNWGTVGPQRQSADTGYTYTALPAAPAALPDANIPAVPKQAKPT